MAQYGQSCKGYNVSELKFNTWQNTSGVLQQAPIQFQYSVIPASSASATATGYVGNTLAGYTTSNTASIYSINFTPKSTSSTIMWMATIGVDRSAANSQEHICIFIGSTCYSSSYLYPRNQGDEPYTHIQSGSYTNSSTSTIQLNIRQARGGGGTTYIGKTNGGGNQMPNYVLIFEYPR
jgi:hypothetical protein